LHQDGLLTDGHPSTPDINRARRRVTTLIETNALQLSQATTRVLCCVIYTVGHKKTRHVYFVITLANIARFS